MCLCLFLQVSLATRGPEVRAIWFIPGNQERLTGSQSEPNLKNLPSRPFSQVSSFFTSLFLWLWLIFKRPTKHLFLFKTTFSGLANQIVTATINVFDYPLFQKFMDSTIDYYCSTIVIYDSTLYNRVISHLLLLLNSLHQIKSRISFFKVDSEIFPACYVWFSVYFCY